MTRRNKTVSSIKSILKEGKKCFQNDKFMEKKRIAIFLVEL
jgi:hypothetical protein